MTMTPVMKPTMTSASLIFPHRPKLLEIAITPDAPFGVIYYPHL